LSREYPASTDSGSLDTLVRNIAAKRPRHAKFVKSAVADLLPYEIAEANGYIKHLLEGDTVENLSDSYLTILDDTVEAQIDFLRTKAYRHASFADVAESVYFNPEYMKRYMIGLALTEFIWPNHVLIRRFFEKTFPADRKGSYLEIGPGHGFFLVHAMKSAPLDRYTAVDISAASIALTDEVVRRMVPQARHKLDLIECDFLDSTGLEGPYDMLVMGEVLEHVEQPLAFLQRLSDLAADGAQLFVTTCLNAPAIDHIYLFRNEGDVETLFAKAGLMIEDRLIVPHPGQSVERCVSDDLPINVAYVLRK
jgi:2-polyprenyl-3-methyl-5-hydroxy-6-metoxy-1,4-benzoquinol methylase